MLEPCEGKLSCTVLRGERDSNIPDLLDRPADLIQRAGRIVRRGNENNEVYIFRYITENTFDAYLFQTLENKQKYISQIMTSKTPVRVAEDVDEATLNYAEIKALATGNPLIKEKMDLDVEVSKLKMMESNFKSNLYQLQDKVVTFYPKEIERLEKKVTDLQKDVQTQMLSQEEKTEQPFLSQEAGTALETKGKTAPFTGLILDGKKYMDKKLAGEFLLQRIKTLKTNEIKDIQQETLIGAYRHFDLSVYFDSFSGQFKFKLQGEESHHGEFGTDELGNITRMDNVLDKMPERLEQTLGKLEDTKKQFDIAKLEIEKKFPQAELLKEKTLRLAEVNHLLDMGENKEGILSEEPLLKEVKEELIQFINREYEEENTLEDFDARFPDLNHITLAQVTTPDGQHEIETCLDLIHYQLDIYVDDTLIEHRSYHYDPKDATSQKEIIQIKNEIPFWNIKELTSVDPNTLKEVMGFSVNEEGNFYDPLSKDMDNDGVKDRYDADFRDNRVQNVGDFEKEEKSVINKLNAYQAIIDRKGSGKKMEYSEQER